jgi:hypothetical protein
MMTGKVIAVVVTAVLAAASARAGSVTMTSAKDNTLYEAATEVSNGAGEYMFAGLTAQFLRRRAVMQFDVAGGVPAGAVITDASLTLHMSRTVVGDQDVELHRLTNSWGEGTSHDSGGQGSGTAASPGDCTWNFRFFGDGIMWDTPGGDFVTGSSATTTVGGIGSYTWSDANMIADVQAWLDAPASNHGWVLVGPEDFASAKRFDTHENPVAANQPALTITYVMPCEPCDTNCDGDVNTLDIEPFIDLLLGNTSPCDTCTGDTNGDGSVNSLDIEGFIDCLIP